MSKEILQKFHSYKIKRALKFVLLCQYAGVGMIILVNWITDFETPKISYIVCFHPEFSYPGYHFGVYIHFLTLTTLLERKCGSSTNTNKNNMVL